MRLLVFFILVTGLVVHAQVQVFSSDLARSISRPPDGSQLVVAGDWTTNLLTLERAPPCTTVRYVNNNRNIWQTSNNDITSQQYFLEFRTRTCAQQYPAAADQTANCDPGQVNQVHTQPIIISMHFSNTTKILKPNKCTDPTGNTVAAGVTINNDGTITLAANAERNLRCFWFCAGLPTVAGTSVPVEVRIKVASNENPTGIFYQLRLLERTTVIKAMSLNTTATSAVWAADDTSKRANLQPEYAASGTNNVFGNAFGLNSITTVSKHYYFDVGPFGSTPGIFWAYASADSRLKVAVKNIRITAAGAADITTNWGTGNNYSWQIVLNANDIAANTLTANDLYTGSAHPTQLQDLQCIVNDCDNNVACKANAAVLNSGTEVAVNLNGCKLLTNQNRRYYVAVRLPIDPPTTAQSWSYRVEAIFVPATNKVLPVQHLRTPSVNGQVFTGILGDDDAANPTARPSRDNYFMVNYGQSGYGIPQIPRYQIPTWLYLCLAFVTVLLH